MSPKIAGSLFALCLFGAALVRADSTSHEVVTNPPTALSAIASSTTDANACTTWTFSGKVSPKFRSEGGTSVRLVCQRFCSLEGACSSQPPIVLPASDSEGQPPANVDSCGNFSFSVVSGCNGDAAQLDPTYFCVFVVHTDVTKGAPNSCSNGKGNQPPPADPNGSAPCSGGYCPNSP